MRMNCDASVMTREDGNQNENKKENIMSKSQTSGDNHSSTLSFSWKYFGGGGPTYWSCVASLSFLCTGLLRAYTSPALLSIQNEDNTNFFFTSSNLSRKDAISWIASVPPLASFIGTILSGPLLSNWGRKRSLILLSITALIGWILVGNSRSIKALLLGRGLTGLASGLATATAPLYISEIVRKTGTTTSTSSTTASGDSGGGDRRGLLPGIMLSIGILLGFILAHQIQVWWKLAFAMSVFPGVLALLCWTIPESPVWQEQQKNMCFQEIQEISIKFDLEMEQVCPPPPPSKKFKSMKPSSEKTGLITKTNSLINLPMYLRVGFLMLFQQWSGGNVMIYYLSEILTKQPSIGTEMSTSNSSSISTHDASAGTLPESIHQASLIIALVQFIGFFLALPLIDHARVGRKLLLIFSAGLMTVAHLFLGFHFHQLIQHANQSGNSSNANHYDLIIRVCSLSALLSCYSIGLGPIPFLFIENPCNSSPDAGSPSSSSSSSSHSSYLSSFASLVNHLALFLAVKWFPYMFHMDDNEKPPSKVEEGAEHFLHGPDVTFWIFSGVCWMAAIFSFYFIRCDRNKIERKTSSYTH